MNTWATIIGMALVTYAIRAIPLLGMRRAPGPRVERALRYVPPAVFAALVVPALVAPNGSFSAGPTLWAGLIGAVVAYRTRNIALTVVIGLGVYAVLRTLLGV